MREVTTCREQSEPATTNDELSSFPAATTCGAENSVRGLSAELGPSALLG
jgi:hypothetical protein